MSTLGLVKTGANKLFIEARNETFQAVGSHVLTCSPDAASRVQQCLHFVSAIKPSILLIKYLNVHIRCLTIGLLNQDN